MLGRNSLLMAAVSVFAILPASGGASESFFFRYFPRSGPVSGCYARGYAAQHMALHPKQRVTSLGLYHAADQAGEPSTFIVSLSFTIAGRDKGFGAFADCADRGSSAGCSVAGGGGNFSLLPAGENIKLVVGRRLKLPSAEWSETDGERVADSPDLAVGGDDRVFLLMPSPKEACAVPPG